MLDFAFVGHELVVVDVLENQQDAELLREDFLQQSHQLEVFVGVLALLVVEVLAAGLGLRALLLCGIVRTEFFDCRLESLLEQVEVAVLLEEDAVGVDESLALGLS